jgi:6-phosphofructokinase 1
MKKKIGILTSGGDCPGLNAIIRGATHAAIERDWEVVGIINATDGLLTTPYDVVTLDKQRVDGQVMRSAGTILGTSTRVHTHNPLAFLMPDGTKKDRSIDFANAYYNLGLSGLIVIGGDGSMGILREVAKRSGTEIKFVGVPKTIDNDVGVTDQTIGFDSAFSVATEALDRLQPTAASHQRVMVLEVMGRDAGHIALNAGIAGGADAILIPEIPYNIDSVCQKIQKIRAEGRMHSLIIVAESLRDASGKKVQVNYGDKISYGGIGQVIAHDINKAIGAECRVTTLGHVQRGAEPTAMDRLIATASGVHAVDLIEQGQFERMVIWKGRQVGSVTLDEAMEKYNTIDVEKDTLIRTARAMGVCLGD